MPSVSPRTSCAPAADLFHRPECIWVDEKKTRRSSTMISPIASSATERELECGSLKTAMPPSLAAARSILSTPMQNAPTATSCGAASSTAAVIRVFERTPRMEAPRTFSTSSRSSSAAWCDSTSYPASRNCSTATALMFSSNRTFKGPSEHLQSNQGLSQRIEGKDWRARWQQLSFARPRRVKDPSPHEQKQIPRFSRNDKQNLNRFAAEEVDQLDYQDDYHHQFQDKGAALVELLHHEAVEIFGGLQFFFDQVFVVGHSDLGRAQLVQARREHVAEEFDGVVGALGQFVYVEQHGVEFGRGARRPPARPKPGPARVEEVVDVFQLFGEQLVVMAELEQLRVGVLQELDRGLGAGGRVVDEGRVPADHGQIVGIVGNARLQNLLALAFGKHRHLAADDLGNLVSVRGQQIVGRGRALILAGVYLANMEDEVILLEPLGLVGLDQSRSGALQLLARDARGHGLEVRVGGPAAGNLNQVFPGAGKGQLEDQADDAVIVVLDLSLKPLAAVEDDRLERLHDRRPLVADVSRSLMLEAGVGRARAEDFAQLVEPNLLADVELDQNQHRAAQGRSRRRLRLFGRSLGGGIAERRGCEFAIHENAVVRVRTPEARVLLVMVQGAHPQRLKPKPVAVPSGTAEAVPFPVLPS